MASSISDIESRCEKDPETGCWNWSGCSQSNGYGRIRINGATKYVHRVVAEMAGIETDQDICHRCDNRKCCNPEHLFSGSRRDNMQDALRKDRVARGDRLNAKKGEDARLAKLTWDQVHEIRARSKRGESNTSIADGYPVSADNISKIVLMKTWR